MTITASQVKKIRLELAKLKPVKVTLDGNRSLTVKEAVFALAPTLERMKKRGFDVQELVKRLHEKGIEVKAPTLAKYLSEVRRQKEKKRDTPRRPRPQTPYCRTHLSVTAKRTETVQISLSPTGSFCRQDRQFFLGTVHFLRLGGVFRFMKLYDRQDKNTIE